MYEEKDAFIFVCIKKVRKFVCELYNKGIEKWLLLEYPYSIALRI